MKYSRMFAWAAALVATTAGLARVVAQEPAPPAAVGSQAVQGGPAEAAPPEPGNVPTTDADAATPPRPAPPPPPPRRSGAAPGQQPGYQGQGGQAGYPGYNPYGYGRSGYAGYGRQPPAQGIYRPFTFSLGIGPGVLALRDSIGREAAAGYGYTVRFGFGVAPNWNLLLSWEGVGVTRNDANTGESALFKQEAFLLGVQHFITQRLHMRGGFGFASVSEETASFVEPTTGGVGGSLAVGYEFIQSYSMSLGAELHATAVQYPDEVWEMGGLNLVFSFF